MSLSIIIVNYKTPLLLADCLTSVYTFTNGIDFEVIVVDNNSADDSRSMITNNFPQVKWIQLDYNAGFARANNVGINKSKGDIFLLLNSDTIVTSNAIGECYKIFRVSEYVACGVQLMNDDGTPQISGNYFMRGGLNNLLSVPVTGKLIKRLGEVLKISKPHVPKTDVPVEVDWINGAFLMVKRAPVEQVGKLDEDFFLYAEEAEWCYRLSKIGRLVIYGQFNIVHLQGQTSNTAFKSQAIGYSNLSDKKGLQIMVSNFVRIRKQFGVFWYIFQLLVFTLTIPFYFLITAFSFFKKAYSYTQNWDIFSGYCKNVFKSWAYSFAIIRNKPFFYKIL